MNYGRVTQDGSSLALCICPARSAPVSPIPTPLTDQPQAPARIVPAYISELATTLVQGAVRGVPVPPLLVSLVTGEPTGHQFPL